jgi:hypothetical protein
MTDLIKKGKRALTVSVAVTTIAWSIGVAALIPLSAQAATMTSGDLIKASTAAVYYYGADGKRYVFPNEKTYKTWYADFSTVKTITDAELAAITIGGNVTYKPGVKMVKITTDPKVYAVAANGSLRWVQSEAIAMSLYGTTWNTMIDDVSDAFFTNYTIGANVTSSADFNVVTAQTAATSINVDKNLTTVAAGQLSVALASDSPASTSVPIGASNVTFTKVVLTASGGTSSVTSLKVTRTGLGADIRLSAIKLYVDGVQKGTSQTLSSVHQATFNLSNSPITVNAGTPVTVVIAADISATFVADMHMLGITAATDITTTSTVAGTFPINGNTMTVANVTIGGLTITRGALNPTADSGVDSNATDVRFTQVHLATTSAEAVLINSVTAIKNGTASNSDVKDIKLVNDTSGQTIATLAGLDSNGRATFQNLTVSIDKGGSADLSIKASIAGSGSGRTVSFDVYDGTTFTVRGLGQTYGFEVAVTDGSAGATCMVGATNKLCQTQTINQGYLTVIKSALTPATGNIAQGATQVALTTLDVKVDGEPVNVSQTIINYTTVTATVGKFTSFTLYNSATGAILAGPKDRDASIADIAGTDTVTFTDAYTLPIGTTVVIIKANVSSSTVANDTIHADMAANKITAKGANSGKSTYTTSTGTTVPPSAAVTGNTQTVKAAFLSMITAATPAAANLVVNAQQQTFSTLDLDASAGGEDVRVSSLMLTDTMSGGGTDCSGVNNLTLWGIQDNTVAGAAIIQLPTSNSTAALTNSAAGTCTVTFTFQTPVVVAMNTSSRLTLKGSIVSATGTDHRFRVAAVGDAVATGKVTGNTLAAGSKGVSGIGQVQTIQAKGLLKIEKSADMPSAAQLVSSSTGNEVMKYKFTASYEPIDVSVLDIFCGNNTQGGTECTRANVSKVYLYANGVLIGNTAGYTLDANGMTPVVLNSGTLVIPKDSYSTITIKMDIPDKTQVTTSTGANFQIGIESADGTAGQPGTASEDTLWSAGAATANDYYIIATGQQSGATILMNTINSLGTVAASQVFGSNGFSIHKGILTVSLNAATPSGTQTAGAGKEVLRLNLQATGDDITIRELELVNSGTAVANFSATGSLTVKSDDLNTTYATVTSANANTYNGDTVVLGNSAISIGSAAGTGACTIAGAGATGDGCAGQWTSDGNLQISAGVTKVIRIFGDTTGGISTNTYQMSVSNATTNPTTTYGVTYWDGSSSDVGNRTGSANSTHPATKNLPLVGGSLSY